MGIAATVLGAQDFTYEAHKITNQVATSYFAYLGANVLNADGKVAAPFKPYLLFNRGGANIGVVGLLGGQAAAAAQARGYRVVPAAQVAQQCVCLLYTSRRQHQYGNGRRALQAFSLP